MAFEGLNNAGNLDIPFIVVLNDNEMSIAPNVGAMSKYLDRVRTDPRYTRGRDDVQSILERLPQGDLLVELGKRWKDSFKEFVYHRMMWEELGFTYLGPVPGHDIRELVLAIRQAQRIDGPVFLHVVTEKGTWLPGRRQRPGAQPRGIRAGQAASQWCPAGPAEISGRLRPDPHRARAG